MKLNPKKVNKIVSLSLKVVETLKPTNNTSKMSEQIESSARRLELDSRTRRKVIAIAHTLVGTHLEVVKLTYDTGAWS